MTAPIKPPTSLRGSVADRAYNAFEAIFDELTVDLPADLVWPLSIRTYATMRRDSTIDSVLQGYTLQMRRATWQLSGRDCDPAVVERTAQDMDLPIVGAETTGAARVRGVSWPEHLRAALSSTLMFGHMGFELGAEVRNGQARLTMLAERLPQTIMQIHSDPKSGAFLGVTQDAPRRNNEPQIPAQFMAWYCREREGAAWQGTSLFRSAWAAHLIKKEMIRVHATGNRRFAMGVPTVEWAPGTGETPAQITAGQQAASAARVGETAGLSLPPGASLKLVGLTGSAPDTLAFLKWLDTQITRAALMSHLELGQNSNGGSRALGEAFIESWTLALEALAEEAAVVATRQIAARLVEWNHGEDEPVPRVVVSGVGSRREVTAESLDRLLSSGALTADPALEAWIRREYRLPERDGMAKPAPSARGDTAAAANRKTRPPAPPAVAQATKRPAPRKRRAQAAGQTALPLMVAADDGSDAEDHQTDWETALAALLAAWPAVAEPMVDELAGQAAAGVGAGDVALLAGLAVSAATVAALTTSLADAMAALAATSAARVVSSAAEQGVDITAPEDPGADRVEQVAAVTSALIASGYASAATRKALQVAGPDTTATEVADAVREALTEMGTSQTGLVGDNTGGALSVAQNAGRTAVFAEHPALSYRAVEINDKSRCGPCKDIDNTVFDTLAEAEDAYRTGGYHACEGGLRCRGFYVPNWT